MFTSKIKTAIFLVTIVVISIIAGCKKSTYYQLTEEDQAWQVYKNNEIVSFVNSQNERLRYLVTLRTKAYLKDGDTYSEFIYAYFEQINDTGAVNPLDSRGELHLFRGEGGFRVSLSWPHFTLKGVPLTSLLASPATIGGVNYLDVYIIDGTAFTNPRNNITRIWYSKKKGVIQLEDVNGDIWIRSL